MAQVATTKAPISVLYGVSPMARVQMIKEGVPASFVTVLTESLAVSKERLYRLVGVSRATVDRKLKAGTVLDKAESESVLALARLIGQVEAMVRTSGDPRGFNAAHWLAAWLDEPLPALGGHRPGEFMDTDEGRALVSGLVAQMQSGAYA